MARGHGTGTAGTPTTTTGTWSVALAHGFGTRSLKNHMRARKPPRNRTPQPEVRRVPCISAIAGVDTLGDVVGDPEQEVDERKSSEETS